MEDTLNALGGILLNAIPTFLLFLFLHFYLKAVFFRPLDKVLKERDEATAGARKRAAESVARAEQKALEFERALRRVRTEIYHEQEELRKQWKQEQNDQLAEASAKAKEMVASARRDIGTQLEAAKDSLRVDSLALSIRIAERMLAGRPS